MKRFAAVLAGLPLAWCLAQAQTDSQQTGSTTASTQSSTSSTTKSSGNPATATVGHWKGTLVDANCAGGHASGAADRSANSDQNSSSATPSTAATNDQSGTASSNPTANQNTQSSTDANAAAASGQTDSTEGKHHKGHRNRAASADQSQGCQVTSGTKNFALKTKEGQLYRFDDVGNMRAAQELQNKKKWTKDMSDGKPVIAKVSGNLNGDTITVIEID